MASPYGPIDRVRAERPFLYSDFVIAVGRSELCAIVDEHRDLILGRQVDVNDHVGLAITGNVAELQCHRSQITTIARNIDWSHISLSFPWIAAHKLHDHGLAI